MQLSCFIEPFNAMPLTPSESLVRASSQPATGAAADAMPDAWLTQGLARAGLRRTPATLAVLRWFARDAARSASHAEVATALLDGGLGINRVTLYRLLDRLAVAQLLVRHTDDLNRTWRYSLNAVRAADPAEPAGGPRWLPRFECDACHRQFRLAEASAPTQAMAEQMLDTLARLGHQGQRVDVSIHGTCAVCVEPPPDAGAAPAAVGP
jgi:Fur family ferric uptake transcriptional regulator